MSQDDHTPRDTPPLSERLRGVWSLDARSLALARVLLALIILFDLADRARDLSMHYTDAGLMPVETLAMWPEPLSALSLHALSGGLGLQVFLFIAAALAAVGLLVGWRTRAMTIVSWLLMLSLHARDPLVLTRGDTILRLLLFWSMWLPLGARASLDAYAARHAYIRDEAPPTACFGVGTVGYLVQLGAIYIFSVTFKTSPIWRDEGTALYYAMHLDHYATPVAVWAREHLHLLVFGTFFTLVIEALGPLLAIIPGRLHHLGRYAAIALFWGLHLGILLTMKLGIFTHVMLTAWLALLPAHFWEHATSRLHPLAARLGRRLHVALKPHTDTIARLTPAPRPAADGPLPAAWRALGVLALVIILQWNLATMPVESPVHSPTAEIGQHLMLQQRWSMFAPYPDRNDGWFTITGTPDAGPPQNLFDPSLPPQDPTKKPESVSSLYPNMRWRRAMFKLQLARHAPWRQTYALALCAHDPHLKTITLTFTLERTPPPGEAATLEVVEALVFDCRAGVARAEQPVLF